MIFWNFNLHLPNHYTTSTPKSIVRLLLLTIENGEKDIFKSFQIIRSTCKTYPNYFHRKLLYKVITKILSLGENFTYINTNIIHIIHSFLTAINISLIDTCTRKSRPTLDEHFFVGTGKSVICHT